MDREVELGRQMWRMLADTFRYVVEDNDAITQAERARVWAGFLASAAGAMAAELGKDDAVDILIGVTEAAKLAPRVTNG